MRVYKAPDYLDTQSSVKEMHDEISCMSFSNTIAPIEDMKIQQGNIFDFHDVDNIEPRIWSSLHTENRNLYDETTALQFEIMRKDLQSKEFQYKELERSYQRMVFGHCATIANIGTIL